MASRTIFATIVFALALSGLAPIFANAVGGAPAAWAEASGASQGTYVACSRRGCRQLRPGCRTVRPVRGGAVDRVVCDTK